MPQPDVILSLSPRMARLVGFAVERLIDSPVILDFDDNQEFEDAGAAEDAADALIREIDEQLRRGRTPSKDDEFLRDRGVGPVGKRHQSDAEKTAAKMAKAARKAVEE